MAQVKDIQRWDPVGANFSGSNQAFGLAGQNLSNAGNIFANVGRALEEQRKARELEAQRNIENQREAQRLGFDAARTDILKAQEQRTSQTYSDTTERTALEDRIQGLFTGVVDSGMATDDNGFYDIDLLRNVYLASEHSYDERATKIAEGLLKNYVDANDKKYADALNAEKIESEIYRNRQTGKKNEPTELEKAALEEAEFVKNVTTTLARYINGQAEDAAQVEEEMKAVLNDPNASPRLRALANGIINEGKGLRSGDLSADEKQELYANVYRSAVGMLPQETPYAAKLRTQELITERDDKIANQYSEVLKNIDQLTTKGDEKLNKESMAAVVGALAVLRELDVPANIAQEAIMGNIKLNASGFLGFGDTTNLGGTAITNLSDIGSGVLDSRNPVLAYALAKDPNNKKLNAAVITGLRDKSE